MNLLSYNFETCKKGRKGNYKVPRKLEYLFPYLQYSYLIRWNLASKKSSTETEYGVRKLLSCSFTYQSKKIRFRSPVAPRFRKWHHWTDEILNFLPPFKIPSINHWKWSKSLPRNNLVSHWKEMKNHVKKASYFWKIIPSIIRPLMIVMPVWPHYLPGMC